MPTLHDRIRDLSADFAAAVLQAIRHASLSDILEETGGTPHRANSGFSAPAPASKTTRPASTPVVAPPAAKGAVRRTGKRGRPKAEEIIRIVDAIAAYVKANPGSNGETVRAALGIEKNRWSWSVARALEEKRITKKGERRSTRYWSK